MTTNIALLRAVNVGGRTTVAMSALRDLVGSLGFTNVRSLLQSGNLVFESGGLGGAEIERLLEAQSEKQLGLRTDFFVRTAKEWGALMARNPFPDAAENDPGHLVVMFLKKPTTAKAVQGLQAAIEGREAVCAHGKQAYITYPDGIGRSRLTNRMIEKHLGSSGTGRNWNTVRKLAALAGA
jgi:uncharacterized protein (DUF1697 family)